MFKVSVKPGHSTGVRRRAGLVFSSGGPTFLDDVPDAVLKDPWLVTTEVGPDEVKPGKADSSEESELLKLFDVSTALDGLRLLKHAGERLGRVLSEMQIMETQAGADSHRIVELERELCTAGESLSQLAEEKDAQSASIADLEKQLAEAQAGAVKGSRGSRRSDSD